MSPDTSMRPMSTLTLPANSQVAYAPKIDPTNVQVLNPTSNQYQILPQQMQQNYVALEHEEEKQAANDFLIQFVSDDPIEKIDLTSLQEHRQRVIRRRYSLASPQSQAKDLDLESNVGSDYDSIQGGVP